MANALRRVISLPTNVQFKQSVATISPARQLNGNIMSLTFVFSSSLYSHLRGIYLWYSIWTLLAILFEAKYRNQGTYFNRSNSSDKIFPTYLCEALINYVTVTFCLVIYLKSDIIFRFKMPTILHCYKHNKLVYVGEM